MGLILDDARRHLAQGMPPSVIPCGIRWEAMLDRVRGVSLEPMLEKVDIGHAKNAQLPNTFTRGMAATPQGETKNHQLFHG